MLFVWGVWSQEKQSNNKGGQWVLGQKDLAQPKLFHLVMNLSDFFELSTS